MVLKLNLYLCSVEKGLNWKLFMFFQQDFYIAVSELIRFYSLKYIMQKESQRTVKYGFKTDFGKPWSRVMLFSILSFSYTTSPACGTLHSRVMYSNEQFVLNNAISETLLQMKCWPSGLTVYELYVHQTICERTHTARAILPVFMFAKI